MTGAAAAGVPSARRIALTAMLVTGAFLAGRLVGVVDDVFKSRLFGTQPELAAYLNANALPELLNNLLSGGALAGAFIPILAEVLTQGDRRQAWRLASSVLNLTFLVTLVLALLILIFAPVLSRTLIEPGWTATRPDLQDLTAQILRFLMISMVLWSITGMFTSVLHAHQHFLLPAIAPVLYNTGVVFGAAVLAPRFGVWGLAYGAVAGMVMHVLIQVPGLVHYRAQWHAVIAWPDAEFRRVLVLAVPRMAGVSVIYLGNLVGANLASRLPDTQSPAALSYAWRMQQLPATVIGLGVATVLFPTLATLSSTGQTARLRDTFSWSLRVMLMLSVPAAAALVLLGRPAIQIVLAGGQFDQGSIDRVMWALQFYALGLVAYTVLELVARTLFAQQDTRTPFFVSSAALVANVLLSWLLMGPLGHGGLALGASLAVTGEVLTLLVILRRRLGGIDEGTLGLTLARALAASAAMAVVVALILGNTGALLAALPGRAGLLVQAGIAGAAGLLVYVLVALALGSRELRALPGLLLASRRRAEPQMTPVAPLEK